LASPTDTAFTRGSVGTGTGTPQESDTALGTVITNWSAGSSDFKVYETGFPTFDTANKRVSTKTFVASTEANSNSITEYGDFNTDGTPIMAGRFVHTAITKTSSIQIFYTPTYRITQ